MWFIRLLFFLLFPLFLFLFQVFFEFYPVLHFGQKRLEYISLVMFSKVRFGKKVMFTGHYGSLEDIKRSFGDSKLKSDECNQLSIPKNLEKDIWHAPKWDLAKKFCFGVTVGHLRWFEGHLVTPNSNLVSTIDSAFPKTH